MAKYIPDFRQGDTYRIKMTYPEGTDLTGYKHWFTVKSSFDSAAVLAVSSVFGAHTGDANNIAYIEASPQLTALIPSGKYVYDIQSKAPNADVITMVPPPKDYKDPLFIAPQVTTEQ